MVKNRSIYRKNYDWLNQITIFDSFRDYDGRYLSKKKSSVRRYLTILSGNICIFTREDDNNTFILIKDKFIPYDFTPYYRSLKMSINQKKLFSNSILEKLYNLWLKYNQTNK